MDFEKIKAAAAAAAEKTGISEYEIYFEQGISTDITAFRSEIKSFSSSTDGGICLRCKIGDKSGIASSELAEPESVEELFLRAAENARLIEKDEKSFIYGGGGKYETIDEKPHEVPDAASMTASALKLQRLVYAADPRVSDGTESGVFAGGTTVRIFNSAGLDLCGTRGFTALYTVPLVTDGDDTNTDFGYETAALGEADFQRLAADTVKRATSKFGAKKVPSGKYDIVLSGKCMVDILSTFSGVFSAKAVQTGRSLLKGKLGEKIASDRVTITDDPFDPAAPCHAAFDAEGVPTRRKTVVESGVLKTYLYNLSTADTDGVQSTGNAAKSSYAGSIGTAPFSFGISCGEQTQEQLFEAVGEGIYVTEMKGFHAGADPVTGDFSIESAGALISGGTLAGPVKEFTVAGNFFSLLLEIEALSDTLYRSLPGGVTQISAPAALIRGVSIGGE